jgi:hypothetical protein
VPAGAWVRDRRVVIRPISIIVASLAFALAVVAGIAESALAIGQQVIIDGVRPADLTQIGVRAVVYGAALTAAVLLYRGRGWARWALIIAIGLLWLGTLVAPMAMEAASGVPWGSVFGVEAGPAFPILRTLHLVLVPIGVIAALRPSATAFLTGRRRCSRADRPRVGPSPAQ